MSIELGNAAEHALGYEHIALSQLESSVERRGDVDPTVDIGGIRVVPIMAANMQITTPDLAVALTKEDFMVAAPKWWKTEDYGKFQDNGGKFSHLSVTGGVADLEIIDTVLGEFKDIPMIIGDVSQGGMTAFMRGFLPTIKNNHPHRIVIGGNIDNPDLARTIVKHVDGVKVGVGPSPTCTTRAVAGVGRPQASAVHSVAKTVRGEFFGSGTYRDKIVIADGGISMPGDVAKALTLGANIAMVGRVLAGTNEAGGDVIEVLQDGADRDNPDAWITYKGYFGSSNFKANGDQKPERIEGRQTYVLAAGPIERVLREYREGLQSFGSFQGQTNLTEAAKAAKMFYVRQGLNKADAQQPWIRQSISRQEFKVLEMAGRARTSTTQRAAEWYETAFSGRQRS